MVVLPIHNSAIPARPIERPYPLLASIKQIAALCFYQLTASLAIGALVSCFVTTPTGISLILSAICVQLCATVFFQILDAFPAPDESNKELALTALTEWAPPSAFSILTGINAQVLIHETGHSLAALAIYKRARPHIEVFPFMGGWTKYYKRALTPLGKILGRSTANIFVIASGPGLTLLVSSILMAVGLAIKKTYPHLSKTLICWCLIDCLNHAQYAYSALSASPSDLSHDFLHLWIMGLHPVAATIGILAIPLLIFTGSQMKFSTASPETAPQIGS